MDKKSTVHFMKWTTKCTCIAEATVTNVCAHFIRKVKVLEYSFTCTCCIYLTYN